MTARRGVGALISMAALASLVWLDPPPARACTGGWIVADGCHEDLSSIGCCIGNLLYWCEAGQTCALTCFTNPYCGWSPPQQAYSCGTNGSADPSSTYPLECPGDGDGDGSPFPDDCDDADADVYPGAPEICDGIPDNDCNGVLDLEDLDDDGDSYTECGGDCDDGAAGIHPGASEICGDGIDSDCGGDLDAEVDHDDDGYAECDGDCDDTRATVYPGMDEVCRDGLDNDCDGNTDGYDDQCEGVDDGPGSSSRSGPYGLSCSISAFMGTAPSAIGPGGPIALAASLLAQRRRRRRRSRG